MVPQVEIFCHPLPARAQTVKSDPFFPAGVGVRFFFPKGEGRGLCAAMPTPIGDDLLRLRRIIAGPRRLCRFSSWDRLFL